MGGDLSACRSHVDDAFGFSLWNGALALSRHFAEERIKLRASCFAEDRTVLELGCGQALVSMVVLELFPEVSRVVATDGSEEVLRAASSNVIANLANSNVAAAGRLMLVPLRWGHEGDINSVLELSNTGRTRGYDVVLGADVTYRTELQATLVDTIWELSHSTTEVWLAHEPREHAPAGKVESLLRNSFGFVESLS